MVYLTRREHFNAAHKLYNDEWSEEKNQEVFGKCANKNGHGHNYDLWVTVKGQPDTNTGFVMNAHKLSKIINDKILDVLDHKNLNMDIEINVQPSSENLAVWIWNRLTPEIEGATLHCVKLQETNNIFVEYYGE